MSEPHPRVSWIPQVTARPMTPEETACDCGCMEIPRGHLADLTYMAGPSPLEKIMADGGAIDGHLIETREGYDREVLPIVMFSDGSGHGWIQARETGGS